MESFASSKESSKIDEKADEKPRSNKLHLVTFEITNGDSQYYNNKLVSASSEQELDTKILKWIRNFWGEQTLPDSEYKYQCWNEDRSECIEFDSSREILGLADIIGEIGIGGDFDRLAINLTRS